MYNSSPASNFYVTHNGTLVYENNASDQKTFGDTTRLDSTTDLHRSSTSFRSLSSQSTSSQALQVLQTLALPSLNIGSIDVLAECTNLATLNLQFNSVRNLAPLSGLDKLASLDLRHNLVKDVAPLLPTVSYERETAFEDTQRNNQSRKITVDASISMTLNTTIHLCPLRVLRLSYNHISTIEALQHCAQLTELWIDHNRIRDTAQLAHLAGLARLTKLVVHPNPFSQNGKRNKNRGGNNQQNGGRNADDSLPIYLCEALSMLTALDFMDGMHINIDVRREAVETLEQTHGRKQHNTTLSRSSFQPVQQISGNNAFQQQLPKSKTKKKRKKQRISLVERNTTGSAKFMQTANTYLNEGGYPSSAVNVSGGEQRVSSLSLLAQLNLPDLNQMQARISVAKADVRKDTQGKYYLVSAAPSQTRAQMQRAQQARDGVILRKSKSNPGLRPQKNTQQYVAPVSQADDGFDAVAWSGNDKKSQHQQHSRPRLNTLPLEQAGLTQKKNKPTRGKRSKLKKSSPLPHQSSGQESGRTTSRVTGHYSGRGNNNSLSGLESSRIQAATDRSVTESMTFSPVEQVFDGDLLEEDEDTLLGFHSSDAPSPVRMSNTLPMSFSVTEPASTGRCVFGMREDGSYHVKWPDGSIAVVCDQSGNGWRLSASFPARQSKNRGIPVTAVQFDDKGSGTVNYPNAKTAMNCSRRTGGVLQSRKGELYLSFDAGGNIKTFRPPFTQQSGSIELSLSDNYTFFYDLTWHYFLLFFSYPSTSQYVAFFHGTKSKSETPTYYSSHEDMMRESMSKLQQRIKQDVQKSIKKKRAISQQKKGITVNLPVHAAEKTRFISSIREATSGLWGSTTTAASLPGGARSMHSGLSQTAGRMSLIDRQGGAPVAVLDAVTRTLPIPRVNSQPILSHSRPGRSFQPSHTSSTVFRSLRPQYEEQAPMSKRYLGKLPAFSSDKEQKKQIDMAKRRERARKQQMDWERQNVESKYYFEPLANPKKNLAKSLKKELLTGREGHGQIPLTQRSMIGLQKAKSNDPTTHRTPKKQELEQEPFKMKGVRDLDTPVTYRTFDNGLTDSNLLYFK